MSLSYYFTFTAPATATADELTAFLKEVEQEAQRVGFRPTVVLNVPFDTAERRQFARRLTTGFAVEDERLKGVALPGDAAVWEHNPHDGSCHLLPTRGVVLVVTDEQGCETAFGFFQYAEAVRDIEETSWLLGFNEHDISVQVSAGLLKPLARPAASGSKFFATVELQQLRNDTRWLAKASDAIVNYWRDKNSGRRNREQPVGAG